MTAHPSSPGSFKGEVPSGIVGIGRPVTTEWLGESLSQFHIVTRGAFELEPRELPGINYVNPDELAELGGNRTPEGVEETSRQVRALIISLGLDETLSIPTVGDEQSLRLQGLQFQPKAPNVHRLKVRVEDTRDKHYPSGYRVDGERIAIRRALGLRAPQPTARPRNGSPTPLHWIKIGIVKPIIPGSGSPTSVDATLRDSLPIPVPFEQVGPIRR